MVLGASFDADGGDTKREHGIGFRVLIVGDAGPAVGRVEAGVSGHVEAGWMSSRARVWWREETPVRGQHRDTPRFRDRPEAPHVRGDCLTDGDEG